MTRIELLSVTSNMFAGSKKDVACLVSLDSLKTISSIWVSLDLRHECSRVGLGSNAELFDVEYSQAADLWSRSGLRDSNAQFGDFGAIKLLDSLMPDRFTFA